MTYLKRCVRLTASEFITAVSTILDAITLESLQDTLLQISTLELSSRARYGRAPLLVLIVRTVLFTVAPVTVRDAVSRRRTSELEVGARLLFAVELVGPVATVLLRIATPLFRDALMNLLARELVRTARRILAVQFVGVVAAVVDAVAAVRRRHAASVGVSALERTRVARDVYDQPYERKYDDHIYITE